MRKLTWIGLVLFFFISPILGAENGTLVIVGGGKMTDPIRDRFWESAGGKKAKIVVIPTASGDADRPETESSFLKQWQTLQPESVQWLHTREKKTADTEAFVKPIQQATAVWFSGGDQSRILVAYQGTRVETELQLLLKRGGVIGGTSAGAAIMSPVMITGGNPEPKTGTGFGFLPETIIDQHFLKRDRINRLVHVLEKHPQSIGIGIDESTAVVVRANQLEVVGESYVLIWNRASKEGKRTIRSLKSGDKISWPLEKSAEK